MAASTDEIKAFLKAAADGDEGAIRRGIDVGLVNEMGDGKEEFMGRWNALHWAVSATQAQVVPQLLAAGVNLEAEDARGWTPLWVAVASQNAEITKMLLSAGANTEAVNMNGRVPLHLAVDCENSEIVKMLLAGGADPRARRTDHKTARDMAIAFENDEIATLLRGAEEEWNRPFVLQMSAKGTELTFHTMGGSTAATLTWAGERPVEELPQAVLEAVQSSGFEVRFQPLRLSNLRLVLPQGAEVDISSSAASLLEQVASA